MKRRNVDCVKPRRPLKRNKIAEYSSSVIYIKFFLVWLLVLAADFLLEFRFEYLWPVWQLLRSVYDSYRYQGLAFSVLFVCMALTSDMICLLFIPFNWLFFAASTYVWVQFVWHTERGVCMPTIVLWVIFIYVEALVRLKEVKTIPFHLNLCRPFAAHCIGYPVVTLGFSLRTYVGYRLRWRRQREVAKENEFYVQLLEEALPPEAQTSRLTRALKEEVANGEIEGAISVNHTGNYNAVSNCVGNNAVTCNSSSCNSSSTSNSSHLSIMNSISGGSAVRSRGCSRVESRSDLSASVDEIPTTPTTSHKNENKNKLSNGTINVELEYMQKKSWSNSRSINDFDESEPEKDKSLKSQSVSGSITGGSFDGEKKRSLSVSSQGSTSTKIPVSHTNNLKDTGPSSSSSRDRKNKNKENNKESSKEDTVNILRLQSDNNRLKSDLQAARQTEQELKNQMNTLISSEKIRNQEMQQLQQDNDNLQNKLHGLVTARQNDRSTINNLERRFQEERRLRQTAESQAGQLERRAKKFEEQSQARAQALANAKNECSESCRSRRAEMEGEFKRIKRDNRQLEERVRSVERENQSLIQYKNNQNETEVLMSALSAMQDKNTHLESSLSAETRVKCDLFSALGEAKRQLEIQQTLVSHKDKEIEDLKSQIVEVMAVCPATSFNGTSLDGPLFHCSSKLRPQVSSPSMSVRNSLSVSDGLMDGSSLDHHPLGSLGFSSHNMVSPPPMSPPPMNQSTSHHSNLDPNARIYTPKGSDS